MSLVHSKIRMEKFTRIIKLKKKKNHIHFRTINNFNKYNNIFNHNINDSSQSIKMVSKICLYLTILHNS